MTERNKLTIEELRSITKLHVLLRIGLDDLKRFEQMPNCRVDMDRWLVTRNGVCVACLAGSVLHLEKGLDADDDLAGSWMYALDDLRVGYVSLAYAKLNVADEFDDLLRPKVLPVADRTHSEYHTDQAAWWSDMEQLYNELKAVDL